MNIGKIYEVFPSQKDCLSFLEEEYWRGSPICPYCKSIRASRVRKELRYHCNNCNTSFSVTVQTVFHRTHLDLQKWFLGIILILNYQKSTSVRYLAKSLSINKNTAWIMISQIRKAMSEISQRNLLLAIAKIDESYALDILNPKDGDSVELITKRNAKKC